MDERERKNGRRLLESLFIRTISSLTFFRTYQFLNYAVERCFVFARLTVDNNLPSIGVILDVKH